MRTARLLLAAVSTAAFSAFATVVGPVFPPPGGHTFSGSAASPGDISRAPGQTFTISVPLASTNAVYFGPAPHGVRLDFIDPGTGNEIHADELTYTPGESNLAGGIAVWRGNTNFSSGQPVFTRFTMVMGGGLPLTLATNLGLDPAIGAVAAIPASTSVSISQRFEASFDGSSWAPALVVFDNYHGAKTAARSSYSFGYYYDDSGPTVNNTGDIVVNLNDTTAPIPFTIGDFETDPSLLTVTATSSNQSAFPDGSIVLGGSGTSRTIQLTNTGPGNATITVTVSDGFLNAVDTFQAITNVAPTISDVLDQTTQKNTATAAIPVTVGDGETGDASVILTASSSATTLVPNANIVVGGSGSARTVTITPATGLFGTTTITLVATDPGGLTATDTFVLTVNAPPRLDGNSGLTVAQGAGGSITSARLLAVDPDGADNQLTFTVSQSVFAGTLKKGSVAIGDGGTFTQQDVDDGLITYQHNDSCIDSDRFVFGAVDSFGGVMRDGSFTDFTFNIAVTPLHNVAPFAVDQSFSVSTGSSTPHTLTATNSDCVTPTYTFAVATPPTKGTISGLNPSTGAFTYNATPGQFGADSFTFNVNDGVLGSAAPGIVSITITNSPPSVAPQSITVFEDASGGGTAVATDPDLPAQSMTFRIGTNGTKGTASIAPLTGVFQYATTGRMGSDSFTVIANDGIADSAPATITVSITPLIKIGRLVVSSKSLPGIAIYDVSTQDTGALGSTPVNNLSGVAASSSAAYVLDQNTDALYRTQSGAGTATFLANVPHFAPFGSIGLSLARDGKLLVGHVTGGLGIYDAAGSQIEVFSGGNMQITTNAVQGPGAEYYVADAGAFIGGSNKILKVAAVGGAQTVLASGGLLDTPGLVPFALTVDTNGDAYVAMANPSGPGGSIYKVTSAGVVSVVSAGGLLDNPSGITFDTGGNLVVANSNTGDLLSIVKASGAQSVLRASGGIITQVGDVQIVPANVPGAPTSVQGTAGDATATITYVAPASNGGSAITGYTATCTGGAGATGNSVGTGLAIVLTGLTNGTTYTCTVVAINAIGSSVPSASVQVSPQQPTFGLSVTKAGAGTGLVTSSPAGINCGATCAAAFANGSSVTLTAAADAGSTFAGWSGACTGTGGCSVTMDADRTVTATFTLNLTSQSISFGGLANKPYPSAPFTVSGTGGGSGNPVVFSSLTTGVCATSGTNGTTVTILTAGNCTIAANQAGNGSYSAAPQVTQSFTVTGIFRAYLSKNGSDANACTLAQPCRLLPAALAVVNEGGEIWMLDSANFNVATVNIAKSVTILAVPGALGSVVGNNADAILISGSPSIEVTLRNLVILNLSGAGNTGIWFLQGSQLTVEGSEIYGVTAGIVVSATGGLLTVKDTTIRDTSTGLNLQGSVLGVLERLVLLNNASVGLNVQSGAQVQLSESAISGSATGASVVAAGATSARLALSSSELSGNGTALSVSAAAGADTAHAILEDVTISHNTTGVALSGAGSKAVFSRQNNSVKFNGTDVTGGALTPQAAF